MKNKLLAAALLLLSAYAGAQVTLTVYDDCNRNGHLVDLTDKSSGKAVDLGLSVRWASCNIGATAPEEYGDKFMWGETEPNDRGYSSWEHYKYSYNYQASGYTLHLTKYCTQEKNGEVDGKYILESRDDAATVNWGSDWRTPTPEEWLELREHCYWDWVTINKVDGYRVTSKINGNSIFIPQAGYKENGNWSSYAYYWTNILLKDTDRYAEEGDYDDRYAVYYGLHDNKTNGRIRYAGLPVRAVRK